MAWLVVLDGDDTLWSTEELYDEARRAARSVVEAAGFDGEVWELRERELDVQNVARLGLSPERFPTSCVEAFLEVGGTDAVVIDAIASCARSVFTARTRLYADSLDSLRRLAKTAHLVLFTKGAPEIQERRVAESGLAGFFDRVVITDHKDGAGFANIAACAHIAPVDCWSIGNSLRSDIEPAVEVGFRAIWIERHVWEYERADRAHLPEHVCRAASLGEAVALIDADRKSRLSAGQTDGR